MIPTIYDDAEIDNMRSQSPKEVPHLLNLPLELRVHILSFVPNTSKLYLCGMAIFGVRACNKRALKDFHNMGLVCKQLRQEAQDNYFRYVGFAVVALLPRGHLPRSNNCVCDEMIKFAEVLHFEMQNLGGKRIDILLFRTQGFWRYKWLTNKDRRDDSVCKEAEAAVNAILDNVGLESLSFATLQGIGRAVEESADAIQKASGEVSVKKAFYVSSIHAAN